jgi:hypothetical protein
MKKRKSIALGIAIVADAVQLVLAPLFVEGALSPLDDALDVAVALLLTVTLGWRWRTLLALGVELVPGLALFPTWTAMVATLAAKSGTVAPCKSALDTRSASSTS